MTQKKNSISQLLHQDDDLIFVHQAYKLLLNRSPDVNGLEHYMSLLEKGVSKRRIILNIASSKEFLSKKRDVSGLFNLKLYNLFICLFTLGRGGYYISNKLMISRLIDKQKNFDTIIKTQDLVIKKLQSEIIDLNKKIIHLTSHLNECKRIYEIHKKESPVISLRYNMTKSGYDCKKIKDLVDSCKKSRG